jgi:hypothetical protein
MRVRLLSVLFLAGVIFSMLLVREADIYDMAMAQGEANCAPKQPACQPRIGAAASGRMLHEARPGDVWIGAPELPDTASTDSSNQQLLTNPFAVQTMPSAMFADETPPQAPAGVRVTATPYEVSIAWDAPTDAESGISYYAYAIGTGTDAETEADLLWWQSVGNDTSVRANLTLTPGARIYVSIYAVNGAGLPGAKAHSTAQTVTAVGFGRADYRLSYTLAAQGYDSGGAPGPGWSTAASTELRDFVDRMLPVLHDLYGPPSISYTVSLVRDQRRTNSAIFYPRTDAIHLGDSATYQLITHELLHAWRNDRILSSNARWDYDPTLSGFEEGFAQAVAYAAMTEFANRHPDFPLTERVYQSSTEWDYDFQNVPELGTTDFWSDSGGTQLFWIRYEMAAAAIAKIETARPGFYRAFNEEYYRRLNATPALTVTRGLVVDVIGSVAPVIEGRPAAQWIDRQHIFASRVTPGRKVWRFVQHYPSREYFVFNRLHTYETFANGSDWAVYENGAWRYYNSNGLTGTAVLRDNAGALVLSSTLAISPTLNPPALMQIGHDSVDLTTAEGALTWPSDQRRLYKQITPLKLYTLETIFARGSQTGTARGYVVMGSPLRNAQGIWGGVIGAREGALRITHRAVPASADEPPLLVRDGAFAGERIWASQIHTDTESVDTTPGVLDIVFTSSDGAVYTDTRAIQLGSFTGSQAFLFDIARMHRVDALSRTVYQVFVPLAAR